jgi:soluble lytic murein transglycosylase-like protein
MVRRAAWGGTAALALWIAGMLASCGAKAQVYTGRSEASGAVVLSSFQSADSPALLLPGPQEQSGSAALPAPSTERRAAATTASAVSPELKQLIDSVASQTQLRPELLHAVIAVESNYDRLARSPRGALGLMQLLPETAKRFGARDPFSAADNVMAGASYLKWLMGLFDNDLELVLAAYNAGEQAVLRAGRRVPPYPETQAYVPRVMARLRDVLMPLR